jgi:hypothetical protein
MTARLLRLFLKTYEHSRIGASPRCYLVCFSQTRDDPHPWCAYGGRGSGVCLGLRLFEIPELKVRALASIFMPVQYVESDWRAKFDEWLVAFIEVFSLGTDTEHNWRLAMDIGAADRRDPRRWHAEAVTDSNPPSPESHPESPWSSRIASRGNNSERDASPAGGPHHPNS